MLLNLQILSKSVFVFLDKKHVFIGTSGMVTFLIERMLKHIAPVPKSLMLGESLHRQARLRQLEADEAVSALFGGP